MIGGTFLPLFPLTPTPSWIGLKQQYGTRNIGLYRDDGLSIFKKSRGLQTEKTKKDLQEVFTDNGLDVLIDSYRL